MKNYDSFTNLYPVNKVLRFKAIPAPATAKYLEESDRLKKESELKEKMGRLQKALDGIYRKEIGKVLADGSFLDIEEYYSLFSLPERTSAEAEQMEKLEVAMKKSIADKLKESDVLDRLTSVRTLKTDLLSFLSGEDKALAESIIDFVSIMDPFLKTRKVIFSNRIPERIVADNLPIFLSNINTFFLAKEQMPEEEFKQLTKELCGEYNVDDLFTTDFFSFVLTQPGIDFYNLIIGGYSTEDGKKIQGLNERINIFNAKNAADNKNAAMKNRTIIKKIPKATELKKQILGDENTFSFVYAAFPDANAMFEAVKDAYTKELGVLDITNRTEALFKDFDSFNMSGVFVKNGNAVTNLSHETLHYWRALQEGWLEEYEKEHPIGKKKRENYDDQNDKVYRNTKSFSIQALQENAERYAAGQEDLKVPDIAEFYKRKALDLCAGIKTNYHELEGVLLKERSGEYSIQKDEKTIAAFKKAMDEVKKLEYVLRDLSGEGREPGRDESFYGELNEIFTFLKGFDSVYNQTRNFITKKPYSTDKLTLHFDNSSLFEGWANTRFSIYRSSLLRKDGTYYIAVLSKGVSKNYDNLPAPAEGEDAYERLDTNKISKPNMDLPKNLQAKSNVEALNMTEEEISFIKKASFAKKSPDFSEENLAKAIDLYKEKIPLYGNYANYDFHFGPTKDYKDIGEFYNDVKRDGYYHRFVKVSAQTIDHLVESGEIYLFRLYTKDFNPNAHGKKDLNSIYFDALFSEENNKNFDYRILGDAKLFYRKASLPKKVTHPANEPIRNKNKLNPKAYSTFTYGLYKDKRYMSDSFEFHLPIQTCAAAGRPGSLNTMVRDSIKADENNHILGVSRGEKTLISVCVIDEDGNIVEQKSFNQIHNMTPDGVEHIVDYKAKLDEREAERKEAKIAWKTVENIKQLKEGYNGQIVHEIVEMARKYNAIIAIEDLNGDFKHSRAAIEKNIYQKFEDALIKKLNFWVRKGEDIHNMGGAFKPYQLTHQFDSTKDSYGQDGIVFYVSPGYTSAIDPTTGFSPMLGISYKTVGQTKEFLSKFDDIRFNEKEGYFEFDLDYDKFGIEKDYQKKWTICTANSRTRMVRDAKTSAWKVEEINLTEAFKDLFGGNGIDYTSKALKEDILKNSNYKFYIAFMNLLRLTCQMKNIDTDTNSYYVVSPIKNKNYTFFDSRDCRENRITRLPQDAAANSAYNIARKALVSIKKIKADVGTVKANNYEWLGFAQTGNYLPEFSEMSEYGEKSAKSKSKKKTSKK